MLWKKGRRWLDLFNTVAEAVLTPGRILIRGSRDQKIGHIVFRMEKIVLLEPTVPTQGSFRQALQTGGGIADKNIIIDLQKFKFTNSIMKMR